MKLNLRLLKVVMILIAFLWGNFSFAQQKVLTEKKNLANERLVKIENIATDNNNIVVPPIGYNKALYQFVDFSKHSPKGLLIDNGPFVTNPGGGPEGSDISLLESPNTNYGSNCNLTAGYYVADDFTATSTWTVDSLVFYGYQTSSPTTSTFTGLYVQIWNGDPSLATSSVVWGDLATNILTSTYWSGCYRATDLVTTNRPIMCNVAATPGLVLPAGDYWIEWACTGSLSSGPWANPISILGQIVTGNAKQWTGSAWADIIDSGSGGAKGLPFLIYGTGGPLPTNDMAMVSILTPITGPNLTATETVSVRVINNGTATQSNIPVSYAIDGGTAVNEVIPGPINSGEQLDYTFTQTADLSAVQTYAFVSTVSLSGDEYPANDSKTKSVTNLGNMILMQNGTMTTCDGMFYDSGGPDGTYQNGEDITMTIAPSTPGAKMKFNFTAFDCETGWDFLKVYDGADVNAPLIGDFTGASIPAELVELIASQTNTSGAITFNFTSDNSVLHLGWAATMSCVYTIAHDLAALSVSGNATPILGKATNYIVTVLNAGVYAELGSNYTVSLYDASNSLIGSANGVNIAAGQTKTFVFSWTPTTLGATYLYGKVVLTGDENPANDQTPNFNVNVIQGGSNPPVYATDFESFTVGRQVACQDPTNWTTWSNTPCSLAEDALISTDFANGGIKAVKVELANDLVLHLGNKTTGKYQLSFWMYIPANHGGYYNLLHNFAGSSSEWGLEFYFTDAGSADLHAGGVVTSVPYTHDQWFNVTNNIDLDNDQAEVLLNGVSVYTWQWSLDPINGIPGLNQLSAADFFSGSGATGIVNPLYYFDDVEYTVAPASPHIAVTPASLIQDLAPNATATQTLHIANTGTADLAFNIEVTYPVKSIKIINHKSQYERSIEKIPVKGGKVMLDKYTSRMVGAPVDPEAYVINGKSSPKDNWLVANPFSGTVTAGSAVDVQVTFDATGLAAGTYYGNLAINSNDAVHATVNVPATLTVAIASGLPLVEDWASGSFATNEWTFDPDQSNWSVTTSMGNPAPSAQFGWSPTVTNYSYALVSEALDATSIFDNVALKFDINLDNYSTSTLESMAVEVFDGVAWQLVHDYQNANGSFGWISESYNISQWAAGHSFRVRFRAHGENSYNINYWFVDNIEVFQQAVGNIAGTVTKLLDNTPVEGAAITMTNALSGTYTATTDANGTYAINGAEAGNYAISVSKEGYNVISGNVTITGNQTLTQNYQLTAPTIAVAPNSLTVNVAVGQTTTRDLTISNRGNGPFAWSGSLQSNKEQVSIPASNGNFEHTAASAGIAPVVNKTNVANTYKGVRGSTAYGFDVNNGFFMSFDMNDPLNATTIANVSVTPFGGTFDASNTDFMYIIDYNDGAIKKVEVATGNVTTVGAAGLQGGDIPTGLTCDKTDGTLYAASTNGTESMLYKIDPATGASTVVGPTGIPALIDITIDGTGQMYGYDIVGDNAYKIDKTNGISTIIGSIGFDASYAQGMGWDPASNAIYMAAYNASTGAGELRLFDKVTGNTAVLGLLPGEIDGFAFPSGTANWASISPTSGVIAPGETATITVTFDGSYLPSKKDLTVIGNLVFNSDPNVGQATVALLMNIQGEFFGVLNGTVTHGSTPVEGVTVTATREESPVYTYTMVTGANGAYSFPTTMYGTYDFTATKEGFNPYSTTGVAVVGGQTTTLPIALTAPVMYVNPTVLTVNINPGDVKDETIVVGNSGNGNLDWNSTLVTNEKRSVTPLQFTAEPRVGGSATGEASPMHTTTIGNPIRALWDILFTFNGNYAAQPGVETDGQYIYTSSWQSGYGSWFHKYDLNGNWIEDFDIAGVTAIRDMAYDGQYFYGGDNGSTIYQMDFTNKVLVGTINTSVVGVRHIAYDPVEDGFWCGSWSDIQEVDRNGAIINSGSTGLSGMYGSAYDPWTAGGPYLWIFDQGGNGVDIQQYSIANGALTGVIHDASDIPGFSAGSSIAGGLCISTAVVSGKVALIGNMQNDPQTIFAYDLGEATAPWITCAPDSGTIIPGASQNVTVHFDATDLTEGTYAASITYTSDPNVGTIIVPVTLNVHNNPQTTLTIATVTGVEIGSAISVPVHATLVNNMGSFQFSIEYNPALMTYTGTSNWHTGIDAVSVGNPSPGHLTFVWAAEMEGINIPDGNFFNIDFTWNGGAGQSSTLVWSDNPTPREFADYNGVIFTPSYVNGSVTSSNGPVPTVTIATLTNVQPGPVSVPVHAANIVNMGSFQFSIEYNPAIMTYTGTSNWHAGINDVTVGNPASGKLTFVWAADLNGVNITDENFFNLNFNYISGATVVNWSDNPLPREFSDYNGVIFTPSYVNGSVTGSNGPVPTVTIATLTNVQPGPVSVPVHATNIVNMGSFQFTIEYDPALLTYTGTSNWHTGIDAVSVGNPSPGHLTFVWAADMNGINIPDGNFFNIDFTWNGGAGQSSTLVWSDNPTPREFADYDGIIFFPTYVNGSISGNTTPQPILSVTPANQNVTSTAGTTSFAVSNTGTGTMSYSAQVTTGNSWLTITNGATGGNNGTIVAMYSQNNSSFSRVGTITITAPGAIGSPKQVTVTQAAAPLPSPELTIGTVNTNPGMVIVPVTARNLINLGSFQFSISYDASKLTYVKDTNWYPGITEITINSSIPGKVSFVWAADFPITLSNNTLFEMKFNAINLGTSAITWTDDPTPREFADWDGNILEPIYVNGGVTITAPLHFVFEGGNPADPVWTIYLSQATLDDMDLQPLDEIAIFDSTTMVGAYRLTEVLTPGNVTDNYITAFKTLTNGSGYTPGHHYSFKCWDVSAQTEINYANVSLLNPWGDAYTGNVFPENDGEYSIADIDFLTAITHSYNLNTGYQFISSYVTPPNADMSVVLAELMNNNLSFVRSSGGDMFRKLGPNWVNNIGNWVITEGYLVKMNAPDDFSITGTPVDPLTPINLNTGYQFISYFHDYPMDASAAFAGILNNNLSFIRNSAGNMLRKLGPNWVNNIGNVVPGEGYLVKMNAPSTLIYPAGTKSGSIKSNAAIQHFSFEGGNAADPVYTIYISDATINGYNLQAGDEIGVFDGQTLVGSLALTQTPTPENQTENAIPVFATLNSGEGFTANHPVTFKLWSQGQEYDGVNVTLSNPYGDAYTGNIFPNGDGAYSIASLKATTNGVGELSLTSVQLSVYPNPSNGNFTIELNSAQKQEVDVKIANSLGVIVYQKLMALPNGKQITEIHLNNLPDGIYTISARNKEGIINNQLVINR